MFDINCAACGRHELIGATRVIAVINRGSGIHVIYRCSCGEPGVLQTGRAAAGPRATLAA
jgi:hypothetical protein